MRKVLMIASLLVLLPLLGYSQRLSDLGNQDRRLEEIFGQSAHSRRLPSSFVASGVPSSRGGESLSAHVMYVPPMNLFAGDYYFLEDGAANVVKHYPDYYFRSAEYCGVNGSVYGYVADLTWGFCKVDIEDGTVTRLSDVPMAMNDLTFDYSHGLMLGTKDGRIYSVNYDESSAMPGQAGSPLYDYSTVAGGPMFLTVAADLHGHLYAVEYDESDASLYRFDITESGLENMTEVGSTGYPAKKLQTMAFDHKTGSLYWWQTSDSGSNFLTVDVETGAATAVVADIGTQMTGLILDFEYREYDVNVASGIEGAVVTPDVRRAYPGAEIKVYVDVDGCYSLKGLTYTAGGVEYPIDTTGLAAGYCTFYMPAADVEVGASLKQAKYAVRFYAMDSVTVVKADTVACGTPATAPADSLMAVSCYDFTGWAQGFDEVTSDLDVYPEYSVKSVNVVVHYVYADGSEAAADYDYDFDCNSEFPPVVSPAIPCYTASDTLISGTVNDKDDFEYTVTYTQNMHGVTLSPESLDASAGTVTVSANPAGCGDTDTISYAINDGYALEALTVVGNSGDTVSYTQGDGEAWFDMPDVDVTVSYTVSEITVDSIANICIDGSVTAPGTSVAVPTYLLRMQGEEDWESYTAAGLEEHVFDTAGTYDYRVQLTNGFGEFYTATRQFTVYGRPSVAIEGNPYICAGSPIELSVSGELAGTFQWYRNGTAIEGATGSTYSVSAAASSDAGSYMVEFTSADSCTFTSDDYAVNVMSLPFAPAIGNESGEAICYGTSAELYFDHGVIDPSDYSYQWFVADGTGVYDTIPGATDWRYATPALTENTGYKIVIRYANEYECESEGTYEVTVKPNVEIQFAGDTVTCMGVNPQNNPAVSPAQASGFTGFAWYFDGVSIPTETGSELHFENYDLDLVDTIGYHTITVTVTSEDGCQYTGEERFFVNQLPTVSLSDGSGHESYINGTVYNDHEYAEFYVCSGTELNLRASGDATGYEWSTGVEGVDSITLTVTEPMEISVTGYNGETGCGNTVYMTVNVNELPAVSITMPAADTTYSMINGDFTFSATPEGGVYTVDGEELESNVMNPYQFGQGEHTVVYTYEDDSLCVNSDTVTVILDKPYWTDEGIYDSMWYALSAANDRYEVANAAELGALGRQVLDGNDFSGITVWLVNDIDLEGYFWPTFEGASFAGTFDGIGKVISNMYVREATVAMELTGTFRNLGVKDPTVISDAAEGTVSLQCEFTNGYATGIDSLNVTVDPSGAELDNFYATFAGAGNQFAAYIAGNAAPEAYLAAETGDLLRTLQDWVFVENSETYRDWVSDGDGANYGYPVMNLSFLPYNLITVLPFEGDYVVGGDAQTRFIISDSDSLRIDYAYEGDMVDISFIIDQYSIIDSVQYATDSLTWYSLAVDADAVSFEMPDTSIYVKVYMSRDYWTNAGNYDEEWYDNCIIEARYEIGSNEELAAMLWEINDGNDFDGITLYVTNDIDMRGHLWPNVKTFKGVFDGNGHIISDIVMRETCDSLNVNAGVIRNVGIQNLDVKGDVVLNNSGSFLNSYFSYDPDTTFTTKDDFKVNTPTSDEPVVTMENVYESDGEAIYVYGTEVETDMETLNAWVEAANSADYLNWVTDDAMANYGFPVHGVHYTKKYNIIIDSTIVNATVTTNPALTAATGTTVTITVTPVPGYRVDSLTYNGTAIDVTVEPYTFEMPAMDVVIYATVVEAYWTDPEIRDLTWYNTTDSEFTLTDPHELGGLSALVSGLDELEADDFEGKTITIAADMDLTMYKWRPIGAQVNSVWYFQGTFEGNGKAITNMNTAEDNGSYQAFFGNIGENGVVNGVNVEGKATGHYFTAGIAGSNLGYIYNSTANVTVTSEFEAGGIVAWNQGTVENCYNTGSVECTSAGTRSNYYVGGIVAQNNGFIYNSHNVGELISGNGSNPVFYYGGIAGYNDGEVDSCYWNGYGEGIGQNEGEMSGCSSFELEDAGVVYAMSYYANDHYTSEHPLYDWTMGEDGYPVFGQMMRGSILNVVEDAVSVMLYPNPAKDVVKIVSEGIRNITVYDVFGQVILSTDTDASEASINLGRNAAGVYVVKVVTANGVATRNIILE